jgi:hypothetical protein
LAGEEQKSDTDKLLLFYIDRSSSRRAVLAPTKKTGLGRTYHTGNSCPYLPLRRPVGFPISDSSNFSATSKVHFAYFLSTGQR